MLVKAIRRIRYGGRTYHPGDEIDMPEADAKSLLGQGHVEQAAGAAAAAAVPPDRPDSDES